MRSSPSPPTSPTFAPLDPVGFASVAGKRLPIGLQLLAKPFDEARLLQIAHAHEQSTDYHRARPRVSGGCDFFARRAETLRRPILPRSFLSEAKNV